MVFVRMNKIVSFCNELSSKTHSWPHGICLRERVNFVYFGADGSMRSTPCENKPRPTRKQLWTKDFGPNMGVKNRGQEYSKKRGT